MSGEKVIEAALRAPAGRADHPLLGQQRAVGAASPRIHVFPKPYSADELSRFVASLVGKA